MMGNPIDYFGYAHYDNLGNRTQKQHTDPDGNTSTQRNRYPEPGEGNRLLSQENAETRNYQYNPSGSPEQIGERQYEYDAHQRPVRLYRVDPNDPENKTLVAEYAYNRFGERIKKVVYKNSKRPKVTYYLYDGHQLTAEADESGKVTAQYLYQNHRPILKLEGKTAYAIHTDHLGAPRAVTDEDGEQVWSGDYSPFGLFHIEQQQITLNLRLPGQYEDQESGTYYNYQRDYDPETGRYLTSDPIGLKGGINTYAYVNGDPLDYYDPLGLTEYRLGDEDPEITYDPGSGAWASEPQTAGLLVQKRAIQSFLASGVPSVGFGPDAVRHMEHYLNNTGSDLDVDVSRMMGIGFFGDLYDDEREEAMAFVNTLAPGCSEEDPATYNITSGNSRTSNFMNQDTNWFYAIGAFRYYGKGVAQVWIGDDGNKHFSLDFEFHLRDRYNWDTGKGVINGLIQDTFWQQFHRQGYAREYFINGTYSETINR